MKRPRGHESTGVGLLVQSGHGGQSKELCFSPDGSLLVSAGRGKICIFDVARARQLAEIVVGERQSTLLACSPCGSRLAASAGNRGLIWDLSDLKPIRELRSEQGALLGICPDLQAAVFLNDKTIKVSDGWEQPVPFPGLIRGANFVARKWLVILGNQGWAVYDLSHGQLRNQGPGWFVQAALSHDGKTLAAVTRQGEIHWLRDTGLQPGLSRFKDRSQGMDPHTCPVYSLALDGTGDRLLLLEDSQLQLIDSLTGESLRSGNPGFGWHLALHPEGQLAAVSGDGWPRLVWGPESPTFGPEFRPQPISQVTFSPDGMWMLTSDHSNSALWLDGMLAELYGRVGIPLACNWEAGRILTQGADASWLDMMLSRKRPAPGSNSRYDGFHYLPQTKQWLAYTDDSVTVLDSQGQPVKKFALSIRYLGRLKPSPDGQRLLALGDEEVQVYRIADGALESRWSGGGTDCAFHPDANLVALMTYQDLQLRALPAGDLVAQCKVEVLFRHLAFSQDGNHLAAAGRGGVRAWSGSDLTPLWEANTGQSYEGLAYHPSGVLAVAGTALELWSTTGTQLATLQYAVNSTLTESIEWLVCCADGRVDGSPKALSSVWQTGADWRNPEPVETSAVTPGVWQEILVNRKDSAALQQLRQQPLPMLSPPVPMEAAVISPLPRLAPQRPVVPATPAPPTNWFSRLKNWLLPPVPVATPTGGEPGAVIVERPSPRPERTPLPMSPLHLVLSRKPLTLSDLVLIYQLLEEGEDPHSLDQSGRAPLQVAVEEACFALIRLLLHYGADPHFTPPGGESASDRSLRDREHMMKFYTLFKSDP